MLDNIVPQHGIENSPKWALGCAHQSPRGSWIHCAQAALMVKLACIAFEQLRHERMSIRDYVAPIVPTFLYPLGHFFATLKVLFGLPYFLLSLVWFLSHGVESATAR